MKPVRAGLAWYMVQSAPVTGCGVSVAGASVVGVMGVGGGALSPQADRRSSGRAQAQAHARWIRARRPDGTRDRVRLSSLMFRPFLARGAAVICRHGCAAARRAGAVAVRTILMTRGICGV